MPNETNNTNAADNQNADGQQEASIATYDALYDSLGEDQRALVDGHINGLKGALQSERDAKRDMAKQLRDASKQVEEGSAAQKQLQELATQVEQAERKAAFYEDAAGPSVNCSNTRLAWIAAQEIGAIDSRGRVNWDALRSDFPELFARTIPAGNAGTGTGGAQPASARDMNKYIRAASGRR